MRRVFAVALLLSLALAPMSARSDEDPPTPEPGFAGVAGTPGSCVRPDPSDETKTINPYGNSCTRLKFAYGPILVQPGDNDTGLSFKTIEKPWYDGYMVGIAPNLVLADGSVPNIEDIHLHHATWISSPSYGNGPFFAAGEEKTIARFPVGYGMPVRASDVWYFVHMIHNEGTRPELVWVTYHVDYVAKGVGDAMQFEGWKGMRQIRPFWLDVWKNGPRASYPVYNTQRGYGEPITDPITLAIVTDPETGEPRTRNECTWPRDECGSFDSWSGVGAFPGQGKAGNGLGTDILATGPSGNDPGMAGTLIGIGGHLHPGGTRVEVDIVRCTEGAAVRPSNTISTWGGLRCPDADDDGVRGEEARRIFVSDAVYFDNNPVSWNFSMTVTGLPNWKVNLKPGEMLRINSAYETDLASWYEGMGIAVAYVHPNQYHGLDPFTADIVNDVGYDDCWAAAGANTLCTRGRITHGPLPEANNPGGQNIKPWAVVPGPEVDQVHISGFLYGPGDLATLDTVGIPRVRRDAPLTFVNEDAAANIFHTVTACALPCNGTTGIAYPLADFGYGTKAPFAFDSSELGFSPDFGPAKGQIGVGGGASVPSNPAAWAQDALTYSFVPGELGLSAGETYAYFCRVHPFMRGAFTVVE